MTLLDTLKTFFSDDDWYFEELEGRDALRMGFSGNDGQWTCVAQAREEQEQFVFYSILPVRIPESARSPVAEFIARANYGLILGNFELDFADGEVRYKTSVDVEGSRLAPAMVKNLVYANVTMMNRYYRGILDVAHGGLDPAEAVAEVEAG